ncbi:Cof-type HAD-IIB family hydrolase [Clostridium luticellarii]|uniref:Putative phosphatase YwpJ n=1 Tax=Clostridium luticellarii TaxID=1691940 RepID=A0A2T0BRK9_9CLOT|nr:Cof-type HAD-IIB family hydrolase [Clostridium luticellarii]MCI1943787.1 Cof-type HAD-IIB family hydrolase [Clostridium luticellarii]MCI1967048.1 Cof-type HAD-IIB family hydrolase [Clostridium luticellarii]MCI1994415.1 Cof-type HAD-IIB family hydrolase [Clostridium luticellarii]MCI2038632.1 Cof-type HAD-IIB family hydrolase [Clostridium luticellarii]PRR86506.1 putative phosphatase YwpJ [Clostridium luticellarii]
MNYKIIAMDMDGTLLDDKKFISEYNMDMIYRASKLGVKVVMATGRLPGALKFYSHTLFARQPVICCNGSMILDENGNIIKSTPMDKDEILKTIDILREEKDTYYHFYDDHSLYCEQFKYTAKSFYEFNRKVDRKFRMEIRIIPDSKEFIENTEKNIHKLVVMDSSLDYLERLRRKIDNGTEVSTTKSSADNIEIISKGTSKGSGLKNLADHYKIPVSECIAVGNDENDKSMIKAAGLGVAVSNARQILKESADYITENDNNHGAIGEIIKKFILS